MPLNSKLTLGEDEMRARIASVPYWFHSIEIAPGIVTPGEEDSAKKIDRLDIPHDLTGKRVLDIGTYDGFFSFECERRGADVVAIDTIPFDRSGFKVAHELIGSNVQFQNASVYDLNPEAFGYFDLVLCLGVIYHLRHPLLGLEHIHSVCKGTLILETQICDQYFVNAKGEIINLYVVAQEINQASIAQFHHAAELNGDPSNWWVPNLVALKGMLHSTGFTSQKIIQDGVRACVHCERVDLVITGPATEYSPGSGRKPAAQSKPSAPALMPPILSTLSVAQDHSIPPMVRDTLTANERDQQVQSYDESFRQAIAEGSSIYGGSAPMPPIIQAAHERRMALLDSLPLGDISDKVCVDYGVGSWGFACTYPRLQACARAIGIDVSYEAIKASAAISEQGQFPYKNNYTYLTSRGYQLQLDDQSVDIFFTGECIEHVENTEAFLDEIHRVLKPDGLLILTTPNADAYLFRVNGEKYGVGPEHVALMSYVQLRSYLDPQFELLEAHGFNGSLHFSWDEKIADLDFAHAWASQFVDRPDLGTGIVLMARRRNEYQAARYQQHYYHHQAPEFQYSGPWETVPLHKTMTGRLGSGGDHSRLALDFEGNGIILNFWCHAWSGEVFVEIDGVAQHVNLYSPVGGFNRIHIGALAAGQHRLQIYGTQLRDVRSQANQVIFYQAVSYQRI